MYAVLGRVAEIYPELQGRDCALLHEGGREGVLALYAREDHVETRWRLLPDAVLCPACGIVDAEEAPRGGFPPEVRKPPHP